MPKRKAQPQDPPSDADLVQERDDSFDDLALETFTRKFGQVRRVSIQRFEESKDKFVHLASIPAELVSEDYIQRRFKGGSYRLCFHDAEGVIVTTRSGIEIADPVDDKPAAPAAQAPAAAVNADPIALLQDQLRRDHELKLAMIQNQKPAPAVDFAGLLPLLTFLQESSQGAMGPDKMMELFMKGMEMGRGPGEDAGGNLGLLGTLLAPALAPIIASKLQQQQPRRAPNPPPVQPALEEGDDNMELMHYIVASLKPAAENGADPALMVKMAMAYAKADPEQYALMREVVAEPFQTLLAELGKVDPDMTREPIAAWLEDFYLNLSHAIQSDSDSARPGGHAHDTAGDGPARQAGATGTDRS